MAKLRDASDTLMAENRLQDGEATVYIQVTRGVAPRRHPFPPEDTPPTVYATAKPFSSDTDGWEAGVGVILVPDIRWARCDIKSISLLPNVLAAQAAVSRGAKEAVMVCDGAVTEGSHTSFCAVFDGILQTHPENHDILPGITRKVVLECCAAMGIPVSLHPIEADRLPAARECMLLGTTTAVMPVVRVDGRAVADGKPGPITRRLQDALQALIVNALPGLKPSFDSDGP